ncbi:hypothetical protein [Mycolicibacterium sp. S3B2]|uniref:hypothetical protein n=1 Tax=Mycolicibacterium sp. S3B2 TaxID=3415120 RepID=UPI003C7B2001
MNPAAGHAAPSGVYHGRGWTVDVGADAGAEAARVASMHEAMHERLQFTTIYGVLAEVHAAVAAATADPAWVRRAATMTRGFQTVHEEFATWMSVTIFGWSMERLGAEFPNYRRHGRSAARRVASLTSPYLAMHGVQAVARSAMQPAGLAVRLTDRGLADVLADPLQRVDLPDHRLHRLTRLLDTHGWGPLQQARSDYTLAEFAHGGDDQWDELNAAAYTWCADLLRADNYPTLDYDGHRRFVRALPEAAAEIAGRPVGLSAGTDPSRDGVTSEIAFFAVESETTIVGPRFPAVLHRDRSALSAMIAGDQRRRHLFLAIRPRQRLMDNYLLPVDGPALDNDAAVIRCGGTDAVELFDITDGSPQELLDLGVPIVVSASQRSLANPATRDRWAPLLSRETCVVMVDLRLSVHLPLWLEAGLTLHYTFLTTETFRGPVSIFVFDLRDHTGNRSRLHIAVVTGLFTAALQLWMAEAPNIAPRVQPDATLTEEPLLGLVLAHIATEERSFDFHAGEQP